MPDCIRCNLKMVMAAKHILFLNSIDASVWGGLEHWMEMCGAGLADKGYDIHFAGREDSLFLSRLSKYSQVTSHPVPISFDFHPASIRSLAKIIKAHNIDTVLCNFVKDVRLAGIARKLTRHFNIIWTPGVNLAKNTVSHRLLLTPFIDRVIVPSRHLRDEIIESGFLNPEIFDILPIGIDESYWQKDKAASRQKIIGKYSLPDSAVICITSGRLVPQKGHGYLIEAARPLVKAHPDIYFLFLGNGELENELQSQIRDAGMESRFVFCGLLEDHRDEVFGADICVHPAVIEPFGIVLVEGMAASLPVIASGVGGIPEVVAGNETALLVEPGSSTDLTKAIDLLYTDTSLRLRLGEAGHNRYRERFGMKTMIEKLSDMIQRNTRA